jgi:Leucine-rich repeat (LRR) protein
MPIIAYSSTSVSFDKLAEDISNDDVTAIRLADVVIEGADGDYNGDMKFSRAMRGHPHLEEFSLINVSFADPEADLNLALSMLFVAVPNLAVVHIENTKLPTSALMGLNYCSTLKKLSLPRNNLSDKDAATVASYVASHSSIQSVDLTDNKMSDEGCAAFSKALEKNLSLQTLKLDGNDISGGVVREIEVTLQKHSAKAA